MKSRLSTILGLLLGLVLFSIALWILVLHRELQTYHLADIMRHIREPSPGHGWD